MRYIAAYMLCTLSGKVPKPCDIENVLSSVGVECDKNCVAQLFNDIKERSIESLIAEGACKLATVPTGGAPAQASAQAAAAPTAAAKVEEAKAEKESSSESDADMGFGLFD